MNRIKKRKTQGPLQKKSANSVNSVSKTQHLVPVLLDWFTNNARDLPWRRTRDPYDIWVSEIMISDTYTP